MGISFNKIITCDGCNKTLTDNTNFNSFVESPNGTAAKLFTEQIVVCDINCFKTFAANAPAPTTGA